MNETPVTLVFPPLVESGLGNVYPSTAVLAASLAQAGVAARQLDLNNRFLSHLLDEHELDIGAEGGFEGSTPLTVTAARWLRAALSEGRLSPDAVVPVVPGLEAGVRNLIGAVALPFAIDPDASAIRGGAGVATIASFDRFFRCHIDDVVPHAGGLVGISVPMGPQLIPALRLADAIARRVDDVKVVLGGPTMSLLQLEELAAMLEANPAVDAVVRMDGERPLGLLVDQVAEGRWRPGHVPGVVALDGGRPVACPPAAGPKAGDLPTPHYPPELMAVAPGARLGVTQARGCYWGKCDYCDFVEVFEGSPSYRGRPADKVVDDIETLMAQTGVRLFRLITESIPPAFARRFGALVSERGLDIGWSSFVMVDRRFDSDTLATMAESGCDYLVVGLESMVTRVLAHVHKSADREENIRFLTEAHEAGIDLAVNLIPDLPSTTYAEAMAGLDDLETLAHCFVDVNVLRFETTRSSRVGREPERFGLIPVADASTTGQAQLAANSVAVVDPAMTEAEWERVVAAYDDFAVRTNAAARARRGDTVATHDYRAAIRDEGRTEIIDFATMQRSVFQRLDQLA